MKNAIKSMKWLTAKARPYILQLIAIVILSSTMSLCSIGIALVSKNLVDAASILDKNKIAMNILIFIAIVLFEIILSAFNAQITARTFESFSNSLTESLFRQISRTSWSNISKYHSDDILTRMTSDIDIAINAIITSLPSILSLLTMLIASFITLLFFDPTLALFAILLGPISVLFSRFYAKKIGRLHIESQEAEGKARGFIHEAIQNIVIVKVFRLERKSLAHIHNLQNIKTDIVLQRNKAGIWADAFLSISYWSGYLLSFGWGAFRLSEGLITFGTLVAFLQLVDNVQSPFSGLAHSLPQIITSIASSKRLMEFEELEQEDDGSAIPEWPQYGIMFENIGFSYETEKSILKDISFKLQPREIIGLIGSSGEGKTTILRIILSLVRPESGYAYITDGKENRFIINSSCRKFFSYVPQGNTLFSGTIADNLRMGNENASDSELVKALQHAAAWEFICELPEGINSEIGERGTGLSEGQSQRLTIARALLNDTPILILDEATSSLDMKTEMHVLAAIKESRKTCIIVTHRDSVLKICDKVFQLENGELFTTDIFC